MNLTARPGLNLSLRALADLRELESLNLSYTALGNDVLKDIAELKICQLNLAATFVTDAGMNQVAEHPQLQALILYNTLITDGALAPLAPKKPSPAGPF